MKKETLQQIADKEGVSRQAIWVRTEKGKAWKKAYDKYLTAHYYQKVRYHKLHPNARYYKKQSSPPSK